MNMKNPEMRPPGNEGERKPETPKFEGAKMGPEEIDAFLKQTVDTRVDAANQRSSEDTTKYNKMMEKIAAQTGNDAPKGLWAKINRKVDDLIAKFRGETDALRVSGDTGAFKDMMTDQKWKETPSEPMPVTIDDSTAWRPKQENQPQETAAALQAKIDQAKDELATINENGGQAEFGATSFDTSADINTLDEKLQQAEKSESEKAKQSAERFKKATDFLNTGGGSRLDFGATQAILRRTGCSNKEIADLYLQADGANALYQQNDMFRSAFQSLESSQATRYATEYLKKDPTNARGYLAREDRLSADYLVPFINSGNTKELWTNSHKIEGGAATILKTYMETKGGVDQKTIDAYLVANETVRNTLRETEKIRKEVGKTTVTPDRDPRVKKLAKASEEALTERAEREEDLGTFFEAIGGAKQRTSEFAPIIANKEKTESSIPDADPSKWTTKEKQKAETYLKVIDETDKAFDAYQKEVRSLKKIIDKTSDAYSSQQAIINGAENKWKQQKTFSEKMTADLGELGKVLVDKDTGRKAGRAGLREQMRGNDIKTVDIQDLGTKPNVEDKKVAA